MPNVVTLTGFKEFEAKLKKMPDILKSEVSGEVKSAAEEWAKLAKETLALPYPSGAWDSGFLAGGIDAKHGGDKDMTSEVTSAMSYSAYMEWGTKSRAKVPADLTSYASKFRGPTGISDTDPKELIYAWAKRKGIPEQYWWPIYWSIKKKGVKPHPFFFIQKPIIQKLLFAGVKKIVETEH